MAPKKAAPPKKVAATKKKPAEDPDNENKNTATVRVVINNNGVAEDKPKKATRKPAAKGTNQGRVYGVRGARRSGALLPPYFPGGTTMPPPVPPQVPQVINNITTGAPAPEGSAPTRPPYGDTVDMASAGSYNPPTAQPYGNTVQMSDPPPNSPQASTASTAATRPPRNAAADGVGEEGAEPMGVLNPAAEASEAFQARTTNRQRTAARLRRQMQQDIETARVTQQVINEAVGNGLVDERDVNAQRALDWAQGETEREIAEEDPIAGDLASAVARLSLGNKRGNRPARDDLEDADGSFFPEQQFGGGTPGVAALTQVFDQPAPPSPLPMNPRAPGSTTGASSSRQWRG